MPPSPPVMWATFPSSVPMLPMVGSVHLSVVGAFVLQRLLEGGFSGTGGHPIDDNDSVAGAAYDSATPRDTVLSVSACSPQAINVLCGGPGRSETPSPTY